MTDGLVVDLFAGPGGWDLAARDLGLDVLGVELDDAAVATRHTAGLPTVQADVSALDPAEYAPVTGLIASPPCQAFSMAGKGHGRRALTAYIDALDTIYERGFDAVDLDDLDAKCEDPRGHLVLEPLRWVTALEPRWVALEQVEPVLPLWDALAGILRRLGYSAWAGVLSAEQYGAPQTRRRAVLIASLDRTVGRPPPTHQRYVAPRTKPRQADSLFDPPEPERIVHPDDRDLLPWVSMADALGWSPTDDVGFPRRADTDSSESRGSIVTINGNDYRARDLRPASEPALVITEKARSTIRLRTGNFTAIARDADGRRSRDGSVPYERPASEPAPTVRSSGAGDWVHDRPATTVAGDPRIPAAGHHDRQQQDAIRVSLDEAAILQTFPAGYPWQGTRTKAYQQIGNAVPPRLASAILLEATGIADDRTRT